MDLQHLKLEIIPNRQVHIPCTRKQREGIDFRAERNRIKYRTLLAHLCAMTGREIKTLAELSVSEAGKAIEWLDRRATV